MVSAAHCEDWESSSQHGEHLPEVPATPPAGPGRGGSGRVVLVAPIAEGRYNSGAASVRTPVGVNRFGRVRERPKNTVPTRVGVGGLYDGTNPLITHSPHARGGGGVGTGAAGGYLAPSSRRWGWGWLARSSSCARHAVLMAVGE